MFKFLQVTCLFFFATGLQAMEFGYHLTVSMSGQVTYPRFFPDASSDVEFLNEPLILLDSFFWGERKTWVAKGEAVSRRLREVFLDFNDNHLRPLVRKSLADKTIHQRYVMFYVALYIFLRELKDKLEWKLGTQFLSQFSHQLSPHFVYQLNYQLEDQFRAQLGRQLVTDLWNQFRYRLFLELRAQFDIQIEPFLPLELQLGDLITFGGTQSSLVMRRAMTVGFLGGLKVILNDPGSNVLDDLNEATVEDHFVKYREILEATANELDPNNPDHDYLRASIQVMLEILKNTTEQ